MELYTVNYDNLTMSSREIAELTGKEHKNVLADIRKMLQDLELTSAEFSANLPDVYGRQQQVFNLNKELTLTLVSGYNVKLRLAIIKRWQELESRQDMFKFAIPKTFSEALILAGQQMQLAEERKLMLEQAKPKVEYYDDYVQSEGYKTITNVAKEIGVSAIVLGRHLREHGHAFKNKKAITWCQPFIDKGYGVMKQFTNEDNGFSGTRALLTRQGEILVKNSFSK